MIEHIEHKGVLVHECSLPGERRADGVVPAHPNGIQLSRRRWLLLYATRSFRGTDDDRSIVYQLRNGAFDGPVVREGMLARSHDDWEPFGDGRRFVRQHGHPVGFGVPRGALIDGEPAPNANLFVVKWRLVARALATNGQTMTHATASDLKARTQSVEWVQFRLTGSEDDIEVVQPPTQLRQVGSEDGPAFCEAAAVGWMNQSFTQAVPYSRDGLEWIDCNHFDNGRIAALKYRYDDASGLYQWVRTGPFMQHPEQALSEASIAPVGDGWIISARSRGEVFWVRTADPFERLPTPLPGNITPNSPHTTYACADGVLRLFTGDPSVSPHGNARDPLYCWRLDASNFTASDRRIVFDSVAAGLPIRADRGVPRIDMCKLLPHGGGRVQALAHRVRPKATADPAYTGVAVNQAEIDCAAVYYAKIHYRDEHPSPWTFAAEEPPNDTA